MFLRKNYSKVTGRTHLAIVQGYRDIDGKNKHKTIKTLGYLDELQKEYPEQSKTYGYFTTEMT